MAGVVGHGRVDFYADNVVGAEPVREQCRVVSGAGADFQHAHPRFDLQCGEHLSHHCGH
jgi:hypothetical protein